MVNKQEISDLLERKYQQTLTNAPRELLLETKQFIDFLLNDEPFAEYCEQLSKQLTEKISEVKHKFENEKQKAIEIKNLLLTQYPVLDDSEKEFDPNNNIDHLFYYQLSFKKFNYIVSQAVKVTMYDLKHTYTRDDESQPGKLIKILTVKMNDYTIRDSNLTVLRDVDEEFTFKLNDLESEHIHTHKDWFHYCQINPAMSLYRIYRIVLKINPKPEDQTEFRAMSWQQKLEHAFTLLPEHWAYGWVKEIIENGEDIDNEKIKRECEFLRKDLNRVYGEIRKLIIKSNINHNSIQVGKAAIMSQELKIDFAIITALPIERKAVCKVFGLSDSERVRKGSRVYWRGRLFLKDGSFYELVVAQSSDMANIDMALLTSDTLRDWNPGSALLVGIAASVHEKAKLGDLVVGKAIYYYERGKQTANGLEPERHVLVPDSTLWNNVTTLPEWKPKLNISRPDGSTDIPQIHEAVIACGEKVIAEAAIRDEIASNDRKIRALEMEGFGFSRAIWQSFERVRSLVFRGICDFANESKGDEWHEYAAEVAAGFARHFLLDRPIVPLNTNQTDGNNHHP